MLLITTTANINHTKRRIKIRRGWTYQIVRSAWIDENGKESESSYYVKIKKQFLFFNYWTTVKHTEADWGDSYKVTTKFKSKLEAAEYIDNVLRSGLNSQCYKEEVIREGNL